ncbi:YveK family protein [Mycolicibacterium litorale]|nr:hypothetical protein [Mycolicibacterium litorale]MCV7418115.1 hypothetical protein [Mycolicibacterium litorale]TDY06498.1 capsular polysaccharide biosynthesis protein [Mycolicibacterium litorale]
MTRHSSRSLGTREILRWWPVLLVPTLVAVGVTMWTLQRQEPSYRVTTTLMVVPLAQWDETFIGTSMVRDSGDASITAGTIAADLDTYRAAAVVADYLGGEATAEIVDAGVEVSAVENSNLIEIVATATDPESALKLSEEFAHATLADRWRALAAELDERIAVITPLAAARPDSSEAAMRLDTLRIVRRGGVDPTLQIKSTSPVVRDDPLPVGVSIAVAIAAGLFIGLVAEYAMVRRRGRTEPAIEELTDGDQPAHTCAHNGRR